MIDDCMKGLIDIVITKSVSRFSRNLVDTLSYTRMLKSKGVVKWTDSGVRGIIKNEKYKGDLLMGKTYTVDPISKRRLDNRGESNKYYTKNHHEAIISEEEWNQAQEILKSRYRTNDNVSETERFKFARKYAFSSMCKCGFCGTNLTRRSHHQDTQHKKPVWKCLVFLQKILMMCLNQFCLQ